MHGRGREWGGDGAGDDAQGRRRRARYYVEQLPATTSTRASRPGVWLGRGAELLGLAGEVDDDAFLRRDGRLDPADRSRHLGRRYGEESVRGFDVTASAPKSVSVLFAARRRRRSAREVLDAHDAAVAAMVDWIEAHAHTRYRIDGEVAVVDAEGIVAAAFRQHTSRALDPQLHTHVVIANRVQLARRPVAGPRRPHHQAATSAPCPPSTTPACAPS